MPSVSVIIPSYNHERYIKECLESVLNQTFQDFEIIITDDGSTDHTVDVIRTFHDERIQLFEHGENRGACTAANNCIRYSSGRYIAMLSSDDAWMPEKLERQVYFLEEHPEICTVFGKVQWIDGNGLPLDPSFPYLHVFDVANRTRFEWLRHFFIKGNCLCHPCSLIRRECYEDTGRLNSSLASLPDFDLWTRLCLKYEIHILDEELIRFRRIGEESNASGNNLRNRNRGRFEHKQILNHYLKLKDPQELLLVFPEAGQYGNITSELIPFFVARTAIDIGTEFRQLWGLEVIYSMLRDEEIAYRLEEQCSFTPLDLIRLVSDLDVFQLGLGERFATQQGEIADLRSQVNDLRTQANNLRASLDGMSQSISWKLTRPLRSAKVAIRKVLQGLGTS